MEQETKVEVPRPLRDTYSVESHLADDLYLVMSPSRWNPIEAAPPRYNIFSSREKRALLPTDKEAIEATDRPNLLRIRNVGCVGIFSLPKRDLIIPVHFASVDTIPDADDLFIISYEFSSNQGIHSITGIIVPAVWTNINYKGNRFFKMYKQYGASIQTCAAFHAKTRKMATTVYDQDGKIQEIKIF